MLDAAWLCTAAAVRAQCTAMAATDLPHLLVDETRLPVAADYVAAVIRRNYPTLRIPHHARWRHFSAGGVDRVRLLLPPPSGEGRGEGQARATPGNGHGHTRPPQPGPTPGPYPDPFPEGEGEAARTRVDLCVVSVLLDAGAGPGWRYHEASTGQTIIRSEGLAVASLHAFAAGLFSSDGSPRADAAGLARVEAHALAKAFQVTPDNPLAGLEGRAALQRSLGAAIQARPDLFPGARPGGLFDVLAAPGTVGAAAILGALLDGLGPIWPGRTVLDGRPLGDVWPHPAAPGGLVPFHKLSQWLAYSLIEVFEDAGIPVTGVSDLTGLPEYRNGGLLLDTGVLRLRDPALAAQPLTVDHPAIVEWRALTVALLDRLAPLIRDRLGQDEAALPLSRILEGGTWAAGRAIAAELRPGGGPPLQVISDGTVF